MVHERVLVAQSCLTLWDPVDCSPPDSSIHGILQGGIPAWVAILFSRLSSQTRDQNWISYIVGQFFTLWATGEASYFISISLKVSLCWLGPHPLVGRSHRLQMYYKESIQFSSVQFSRAVMSYSLQPHRLQHSRTLCPSQMPGVYLNSCPLSWWCHPTISSSAVLFCSHLQSFPASGSF